MNKDKLINLAIYTISIFGVVHTLHNSGADAMLKSLNKKGLKIIDEAGEVVDVGVKYFWNKK